MLNRCQTMRLSTVIVGALWAMNACAGTSQAVCSTNVYISAGASSGSGSTVFFVENLPGTMGAALPGNLVFSLTGNARLRSAKVVGTNSAFAASTPANGARVLTTAGNGNAALPSAAAGTGQIVFGGITFSSTYLVDAGADTLVISNDAGVAPTAIDSAAATAGSDLTYGEYLTGLMKAFNSVFAPTYYAVTVPATGGGSSDFFSYSDPSAAAPVTMTLNPDVTIGGGPTPISIGGGLTAVTATANAVPSKYIAADGKLVVPFNYAPGTSKDSLVVLSDIVLDARGMKQGDVVGIQIDPTTTTSGVTSGVVTNIAYTSGAISYPTVPTPMIPSRDCGSIGPLSNRTQVVQIPAVSANDLGRQLKYYVAAWLPNHEWYFLNSAGDFVLYTGGEAQEWASGAPISPFALILSNADVSSIVGTTVYAGYGSTVQDMVQRGTYGLVLNLR